MGIFNVLAVPLGIAMKWIYQLVSNYGWTIIIFTFLVRIAMFPLSLKQQKSTARMSAYQPMIKELQKKWANDKNRQNAEMQKFYEENNIKMSAGCAPMLVNMLVLFGMIAVIQAPLTYIVNTAAGQALTPEQITQGVAIVQHYEPETEVGAAGYTQQSILIGEMKTNRQQFVTGAEVPYVNDAPYILMNGEKYQNGQIVNADGKVTQETATLKHTSIDAATLDAVDDFNFRFLGLNLADAPTTNNWVTLVMPILSILTMVLSQLLMMKLSPTGQGKGQMLVMTVVFGVMFGFFAFRVPAGFSLYYTVSNIVMTLQQIVVRQIYDPEKIRAEVEAEIAERRAAKKTKKKVVIADDGSGEDVERELSESELNRLRLERARLLDAERYGDKAAKAADEDEDEDEDDEKTAKARRLDEAKYGKAQETAAPADADDVEPQDEPDAEDGANADTPGEAANAEAPAEVAEAAKPAVPPAQQEYKPGRRKRARQSRERDKQDVESEASALVPAADGADKED